MTTQRVGVMLMTYGSPATLDDIEEYMTNVRGGRKPEPELLEEFRRRYDLIGGSPLLKITQEQAMELEKELNACHPDGPSFRVMAGMRFAPPYITDLIPELAQEVDTIIGLIMSPQYSPIIMSGYVKTITQSVEALHRPDLTLKIAGDWHLQPDFVQAVASKVTHALEAFPEPERDQVPVLLSAHSMPKPVVEREPIYINNLKETASAIARKAGLADDRWSFCYQSAGHTPEEWLKPDFADMMPELAAKGKHAVLIAPVQFLADHLEILYDIEVGAREQAEEHEIQFSRTSSLNTDPLFIKAMASVVEDTLTR